MASFMAFLGPYTDTLGFTLRVRAYDRLREAKPRAEWLLRVSIFEGLYSKGKVQGSSVGLQDYDGKYFFCEIWRWRRESERGFDGKGALILWIIEGR